MQPPSANTILANILPLSIIGVLIGDWVRLRLASHAEERKHIARAISDLLQLRYIISLLPEFPKYFQELMPQELRDQVPPDIWRSIDFAKAVPMDEEFPKRYRKAIEEIAGFRPVLAYQLRDKERYFDLRNFLSQHLSQSPGSPSVANEITEVVDREALATLNETLLLLAKAHGVLMRFTIWRILRKRCRGGDIIPPEIKKVFQQQMSQVIAAASSQTSQMPTARKLV